MQNCKFANIVKPNSTLANKQQTQRKKLLPNSSANISVTFGPIERKTIFYLCLDQYIICSVHISDINIHNIHLIEDNIKKFKYYLDLDTVSIIKVQ